MRNYIILLLFCCLSFTANAQMDSTSLLAHIDQVTKRWDEISKDLSTYKGLNSYCRDNTYKKLILSNLNSIHHYDSVVYDVLVKKNRFKKSKEISKTLKQIKKLESDFTPKNFLSFLHEECSFRREIEKNKDESKNSFGEESYGGQILVLENELSKYVKHITKLVDGIRDQAHHLHLENIEDQ